MVIWGIMKVVSMMVAYMGGDNYCNSDNGVSDSSFSHVDAVGNNYADSYSGSGAENWR